MNNLSSYGGLVDANIKASDKDLPVAENKFLVQVNLQVDKFPKWRLRTLPVRN